MPTKSVFSPLFEMIHAYSHYKNRIGNNECPRLLIGFWYGKTTISGSRSSGHLLLSGHLLISPKFASKVCRKFNLYLTVTAINHHLHFPIVSFYCNLPLLNSHLAHDNKWCFPFSFNATYSTGKWCSIVQIFISV